MKDYVLTILVTVAIVVLSIIPIPEHAPLSDFPLIDKWVHMVMYGGLAFVMWFDRVARNKGDMSRVFWILMFVYPMLLGGLMELVQAYWTTCRSGDWIDFEADAIGAALGLLISFLFNKLWNEKISGQR